VATAAEGTGERVGGEGRPGRDGGHRGEVTVLGMGADLTPLVSPHLIFFSGLCSSTNDVFCRNESLPTPSF
jgi:hypothetical protein